jgi:predicted RNase H-like nuclease (RuvC/YqgF family)
MQEEETVLPETTWILVKRCKEGAKDDYFDLGGILGSSDDRMNSLDIEVTNLRTQVKEMKKIMEEMRREIEELKKERQKNTN